MIHSKSQSKWRPLYKRSLLLFAVLSMVISLLGLPLYAKTIATNSPAGRMVDDIKRGARDLGRDVRDMVDPDRDGILPDGSIDNGIANDGNQFNDNNSTSGTDTNRPHTSSGALDEVLPNAPVTDGSNPSPENNNNGTTDNNGNMTDNATDNTNGTADNKGNTTDAPTTTDTTTTDNNANGDNTDGNSEGGFRWTGLIVAIVIAIAVIVLICLLIPRKKNR